MDSLLSHIARTERERLQVTRVDVDEHPELADKFEVDTVPTLVLVVEKRAVARLEGRSSQPRIERMLAQHLGENVAA